MIEVSDADYRSLQLPCDALEEPLKKPPEEQKAAVNRSIGTGCSRRLPKDGI
jgi:hypothetical protein